MDYPKCIVLYQKEESISLQKVKVYSTQNFPKNKVCCFRGVVCSLIFSMNLGKYITKCLDGCSHDWGLFLSLLAATLVVCWLSFQTVRTQIRTDGRRMVDLDLDPNCLTLL